MSNRTCTMPDCERPYRARGLCGSHYNQQHAPNRHAKKLVACSVCGKQTLKPATNNKGRAPVCSYACRERTRQQSCPRKTTLPADHWARWYGKTSAWPRAGWRTCEQCTNEYAAIGATSKYCSSKCGWLQRDRNSGVRSIADVEAEDRRCARCDAAYRSPHVQRIHCSDLCRELARIKRGVALHHGWISDAERQHIYERDAYTCWLCNEAVDLKANPQRDNWAPSLDHVMPRSKGGTHDHNNLRTAHRWCNSIRSDSGVDSLMALAV